jgi:hypothetical protein
MQANQYAVGTFPDIKPHKYLGSNTGCVVASQRTLAKFSKLNRPHHRYTVIELPQYRCSYGTSSRAAYRAAMWCHCRVMLSTLSGLQRCLAFSAARLGDSHKALIDNQKGRNPYHRSYGAHSMRLDIPTTVSRLISDHDHERHL